VAEAPRTVIVVRSGALGDIVYTAPAVEALATAWPESRIVFVTKSRFAELVRHNPHVDEVLAREDGESLVHFRARVAKLEPDAALDLHGKIASRLICSLAERRVRFFKRPWTQSLAVRLRLRPHRAHATIAARYHRAVEELVGKELPPGKLRYWVSDDARRAYADLAQSTGLDLTKPILGMAPGAAWETKRWPADRFGALASRALDAGVQVALTGSDSEAPILERVRDAAPRAVNLAGKVPLSLLGAFVEKCSAFVANDSGPMHIARALCVPTLALFGSTDPGQFDFTGHAALSVPLPCAPCSLYGLARCPQGHFKCMLDLDVDGAWSTLRRLLDASRPLPVLG
jgi:heptosyltransferase II